MSDKRKPPPTVAIILMLAALLAGYVLSYSPYIRYRYGADDPSNKWYISDDPYFAENDHAFYAPVEWLIDKTPATTPMLWWAEMWDVRLKVSLDSRLRWDAKYWASETREK